MIFQFTDLRGFVRRLAMVAIVSSSGAASIALAQQNQAGGIETLQIAPNFYMIAGAGANIAVQVGRDGVFLVNAGSADMSDKVIAAVKKLTPQPIRYIVDTSDDADVVGGNGSVSKAGLSLVQNRNTGINDSNHIPAIIVATENVLNRMSAPSGKQATYPDEDWPGETFAQTEKPLYINREGIQIMAQPAAHTDGDVMVYFRRSDVLVTGDIMDTTVSGDRRGEGRQHSGRDRRAEPDRGDRDPVDSAGVAGRRHDGDSGSRTDLRSGGCGGIPRHGDDHPGRGAGHDYAGYDAGADQEGRSTSGYRKRDGAIPVPGPPTCLSRPSTESDGEKNHKELDFTMKRIKYQAGAVVLLLAAMFLAVPASAEVDLAGNWDARNYQDWQERSAGPDVVDYLGLPINAEAREKALAYSASVMFLPERHVFTTRRSISSPALRASRYGRISTR